MPAFWEYPRCPTITYTVNSYRTPFIPRQNYVAQIHECNKPGTYGKGYAYHYICMKFESSSIENSTNNAKKVQITN